MAAKKKASVKELTPDGLKALINKQFGDGTMRMASDPSLEITRLPSGILSVDVLIGGGFPRNRHAELFGGASVGKSYLAQKLIATTQQNGGRGAWVDCEKTFDPLFAETCGIDLDNLAFHIQEHGPMCVNFMETVLRSELYDVIVLDSISALLPQYEYENEMGAGSMGMEQAKLMSTALRKLTAANKSTSIVFINQTREAVGGLVFGKKTTTSGGRAMGFYAGLRLELVKIETTKKKGRKVNPKTGEIDDAADVAYGHRVLVRGEKDKTGGLFRPQDETTFVFDYEAGAHDPVEDLLYLGRLFGYIEKSGDNWWVENYEKQKKNGRARFKKWLIEHEDVQGELEANIRAEIEAEVE
jgi:recombination protein RecA